MRFGTPRKVALVAVLLAILIVATETLSYIVILVSRAYLDQEIRTTSDILREQTKRIEPFVDPDSRTRTIFDPQLGWRYRPNYHADGDQLNSQGLRSSHEYSTLPPARVTRVAAFGDSFVYCNEVGNRDSWPSLIETMYPDIEILNYGVGGYGTDQAYLRFQAEGSSLSPQVVIVGFSPAMLRRVVNVYRRFISNREVPLVKPRFVIDEHGNLVLLPTPLRRLSDYRRYIHHPKDIIDLGKHDYWYEPAIYENPLYDLSPTIRLITAVGVRVYRRYIDPERIFDHYIFNPSSTAFRIQTALLEAFVRSIQSSGATALIAVFPDSGALETASQGQGKSYDPLLDYLKNRRLNYVDLSEAFPAERYFDHAEQWFMVGGHYSPAGNRIVADWLGQYIRKNYGRNKN